MNTFLKLNAPLVVAAMLALPAAQADTMTQTHYNAGKTRIGADYKANKAACATLAGNANDICVEQAKATAKIALAELEYGYTGKPADHNKVLVTRAEAAYAVAKERCDDKAGNVKDICVEEAKAVETKALADARMGKQIGEAEKDAIQARRDADYRVAVEKCDTLSGDAKSGCLATAKANFGKT
jgi:hypothetical protein